MVKADRHNIDATPPAQGDVGLFVTVFTDGSYCPETKAYGCAIWVKDGVTTKPLIESWGGYNAPNSQYAEEEALFWAVKHVAETAELSGRIVVIQSDCLDALNKLDTKPLRGAKYIKLKHVKAHTSNKTKRSKVNAIVDDLAGKKMLKYRKRSQSR